MLPVFISSKIYVRVMSIRQEFQCFQGIYENKYDCVGISIYENSIFPPGKWSCVES